MIIRRKQYDILQRISNALFLRGFVYISRCEEENKMSVITKVPEPNIYEQICKGQIFTQMSQFKIGEIYF